jgi:tetratricopeptide (TPR) repeat protein
MDEVFEQEPDAILIYAGHNEFYGALGVASMESLGKYPFFVRAFLKLQRFKTFLLLRDIVTYFRQVFAGSKNIESVKKEETAMAKLAKDQLVKYNSDEYEKGKSQFRENLSAIIESAKERSVRVILSELVSNVKDHLPFSQDSNAREIYTEAINAEREGDYVKARELYYKAKDYDAIRFRASEDFNEIIQEIAGFQDLPIVPMKSYFEKESKHRLIGNNLMHEHLHPKKNGYFLMADAFYDTMKKNKFISGQWPSIRKNYSRNWGFTDLDSVYAHMSIIHLMGDWPFVQSGKENDALERIPKLNYVDSLAYKIHLDEELTLEWGHLDLGRYYEQRGEYRKALGEYIALIYQMPNADAFYEPAVKLLSKTKNYSYAVGLLTDALKYHKSTLVYSWIGQFSSATGNYEQARKYLELGITDRPRDILVLYHLAMSYYKLKLIEKGDRTLRKLEMINPSLKQVAQLKQLRTSVLSSQN